MDEDADTRPVKYTKYTVRSRAGYTVKYIIIHAISGEAGASAYTVARGFELEPEYGHLPHYLIDEAGDVLQMISENHCSWANRIDTAAAQACFRENAEKQSISIMVVKTGPCAFGPITFPQSVSLFSLIKRIILRHPQIRKERANCFGGITGHCALAPLSKFTCPGLFPWAEMWAAIRDEPIVVAAGQPDREGKADQEEIPEAEIPYDF